MEKVLDVAQFIFQEYKKLSGSAIDEMKLHKLLYFSQREAIAITGSQLFDSYFEGWKYGPVCSEVRCNYTPDGINAKSGELSFVSAYIVKNIIEEYGSIESWKLSEITHKEISWLKARKGLAADEPGNRPIQPEDIREDAKKIRPYDHIWDMYYDEFENAAVPS